MAAVPQPPAPKRPRWHLFAQPFTAQRLHAMTANCSSVTLRPSVVLSAKSQFLALASAVYAPPSTAPATAATEGPRASPSPVGLLGPSLMTEFGRLWVTLECRWEGLSFDAEGLFIDRYYDREHNDEDEDEEGHEGKDKGADKVKDKEWSEDEDDYDEEEEEEYQVTVSNRVFVSMSCTLGVVRIICQPRWSPGTLLGSLGEGRFLLDVLWPAGNVVQNKFYVFTPWIGNDDEDDVGTGKKTLMSCDLKEHFSGHCNSMWIVLVGYRKIEAWKVDHGEPVLESHVTVMAKITKEPPSVYTQSFNTAAFSRQNGNILMLYLHEYPLNDHVLFIDIEKTCETKSLFIEKDVHIAQRPTAVLFTEPAIVTIQEHRGSTCGLQNSTTGQFRGLPGGVRKITDQHFMVAQSAHDLYVYNKVTVFRASSHDDLASPCFSLDPNIEIEEVCSTHNNSLFAPRIHTQQYRIKPTVSSLLIELYDVNSGVRLATLSASKKGA
ncbi:hypothetical protein Pelo_5202 [Pelomyxa schiedti]|nr:hypothetical protein Pelo_5202 [Pelomyxa schiedti]